MFDLAVPHTSRHVAPRTTGSDSYFRSWSTSWSRLAARFEPSHRSKFFSFGDMSVCDQWYSLIFNKSCLSLGVSAFHSLAVTRFTQQLFLVQGRHQGPGDQLRVHHVGGYHHQWFRDAEDTLATHFTGTWRHACPFSQVGSGWWAILKTLENPMEIF